MSLAQYCRDKRTVIQSANTTAYDAARALEANHIGAIIVQEGGRVVGVVTDRDLLLRVVGFHRDPTETRLRDVMTPEPATLSIEDSEQQAIELMRAWHVRRIPIVDGERIAGIVTLDDLILSGAVDLAAAADIVAVQLGQPSRAKPAGLTHPSRPGTGMQAPIEHAERHATRAAQTLRKFSTRLQRDLGLDNAEQAVAAFEVVASGLVRRLTASEAQHFASQLPSTIRGHLLDLPGGPDLEVTRESIERDMAHRLELDRESAAMLVREVCMSLGELVSPGEIQHVVNQLPRDMKEIFAHPA